MFFEVPDEVVLPAEFVVVFEMVDLLARQQFLVVEFRYELLLAPDDVPGVILYFLVASSFEGLLDAVAKVGLVADEWTRSRETYIWEWYSCLMYFLNSWLM